MTAHDSLTQIKHRLQEVFHPTHLVVIDESHQHIGHVGAKEGGGHFAIEIVSDKFRDKSVLEQHRLIYQALGALMQTEIHALRIKAKAP